MPVGEVTSIAVSADGRVVASAGHDRTVRLWEVAIHGAPIVDTAIHEVAGWQMRMKPEILEVA